MLGDWPERDAQGGKLAGMKTRLAKYGQIQQAKADYQIESFSKLLTMVDRCDKEGTKRLSSPRCFELCLRLASLVDFKHRNRKLLCVMCAHHLL